MARARKARKDRVLERLLHAQAALVREEDEYLEDLLKRAEAHRPATLASGQPRVTGPPLDKRVIKALQYIHANLGDRRMPLAAIASASHVSQFHLERIFGEALGAPPRAYLRQQRLQLAKELPAHRPGMTIAAVSVVCGLASQAHLSVLFKKEFGTSPAAFRKAAQRRHATAGAPARK